MATPNQDNLESLLKENLKKTDLIIKKVEKFEKDFKKAQYMVFLRFILVAIPVVLALLYLIPLFREFLEVYRPVLDFMNQFRVLK